jgi:hypothetical protein
MDLLLALVGQPLDAPAVRAILDGEPLTAEPLADRYSPERTLSNKPAGYEIRYRKGRKGRPDRIEVVFLYLEPRDGYSAFQGELSSGLSPTDDRSAVAAKLGAASRSGAADPAGEWPWERYDSARVCVHLGYGQRGVGLRMITLMAPDIAP